MSEKGSIIWQVVAALGATLGAFSLGTVLAWSAPAQSYLNGEGCVDNCLTNDEWSQVAALPNIGALSVQILTVFLFPMIGKKWTMIGLVVPFILGWVILLVATEAWMFYVGRLLTGFSGGAFAVAAPAYTNEIAEPRIRGALGALMQLMICLGILFIFICGTINWKIITGVCIVFPALLAVWMFFMPRSPKFLLQKGKVEEARKSLQFFRGKKDVDAELKELAADMAELEKLGTVSPLALFTNRVYLQPLLISLMLMAFQQFSGINFVISYSVEIFKDAGSDIDKNLSSILIGIVQVVGTSIAILIVDRFGRKILLTISASLMFIGTCALGVFFYLKGQVPTDSSSTTTISPVELLVSQETIDSLGPLPLISLMLFIAGFSIGFGPLPWVMNVELFSPEARIPAAAICSAFNWISSYLVVSLVPAIQTGTSPQFCYFLFSGVCLLATLFVVFVVPETKGKTDEDMKNYFSGIKKN